MTNRNIDIPKANILIVDNASDNLRLLVGMFTEHGYDVRAASDGAFGLESARVTPPDLILRDIRMPDMDGYTVCKELKADEYTRDIPVIFISALDDVTDNEIFIGTHMTERPYVSLRTPRNDTRFSKNGTLLNFHSIVRNKYDDHHPKLSHRSRTLSIHPHHYLSRLA